MLEIWTHMHMIHTNDIGRGAPGELL